MLIKKERWWQKKGDLGFLGEGKNRMKSGVKEILIYLILENVAIAD